MSRRQLPAYCPCPSVRHNDGNPWIRWPDPNCPHHGRAPQPRPATVIPIRKAAR